jgi:thymidylate kinase
MLVIIEGADKTGKTTLAKAIAGELGYEYVHFSTPKGPPADEYIDFLLALKRPTVCDRFHLGELVYGPLLRGKPGLTPLQLATIERVMRLQPTVVIHAVTDMKLANDRLVHSTEHEVVNTEQNKAAARLFAEVVPNTNAGPVLRYNGVSQDDIRSVIAEIRKLEVATGSLPAYTGIGTVTGQRLVFVGEQVNQNVTWRGLPFDKGASSQFLLDVFAEAGVPEKAVYICNADKLTEDEAADLDEGRTRFISLGKKADNKLAAFGIPHKALPHPQWVKRFNFRQKDAYINDMRQACL